MVQSHTSSHDGLVTQYFESWTRVPCPKATSGDILALYLWGDLTTGSLCNAVQNLFLHELSRTFVIFILHVLVPLFIANKLAS